MFDLRPFLSSSANLRRRKEWFLFGIAGLCVAAWLVIGVPALLSGAVALRFILVTVVMLGFAGFFAIVVPVFRGFGGGPSSLSVEPDGVRVSFDRGRGRVYRWANARTWLEVFDMSHCSDKDRVARSPSPYGLQVDAGSPVWLPPGAAESILSGAKAAGLTIKSQVMQVGKRWVPGTTVYTDERRRFL
jgi:hypothetical protein